MIGFGVGLASCIAPLYIQELSPTRLRARMVAVNVVAITGGQVIAYGIDAAFQHMHGGWRWMVGLGTVPAGLQFVFLFFLPESRAYHAILPSQTSCTHFGPFYVARILMRRGKPEAAYSILSRIYSLATPQQVELKVRAYSLCLLVLLMPSLSSINRS